MDDGTEVFSGAISALDPHCGRFLASGTALLATVNGAGAAYTTSETPGYCGAGVEFSDGASSVSGSLSLTAEPVAEVMMIDRTFPDLIGWVYDLMEQHDLTEDEVVMPQQFSAPGWTYGFITPTGGDDASYDVIGLVLTTQQTVLQCQYRGSGAAPLSQDAVVALCDEFRALVYAE